MIKKIKRLAALSIKFVANHYGYKIVMVKIENDNVTIEGDDELIKHTDITGYWFEKGIIKNK